MNIMVCYTGSRSSQQALELGIHHAKAFKGRLLLVASLEKGTTAELDEINQLNAALDEAAQQVRKDGIDCDTRLLVRGLSPGEDLVNHAREENMDEIVIGIRKRSKTGKLIFGSTAQYIILNAPCPVVTVK